MDDVLMSDRTTQELLKALSRPFGADEVEWRVGSTNADKTKGLALAYMDARLAMNRLDDVMGADWRDEYAFPSERKIIVCTISLKIGGEWIPRADGDDVAHDGDMEVKGALSGAFKRAAVRWGIGRYLYGFDSPWVAIDQRGKSFVIRETERPRLRALAAAALAEIDKNPNRIPLPPEPAPGPVGGTAPTPQAASPNLAAGLAAAVAEVQSLDKLIELVKEARERIRGREIAVVEDAYLAKIGSFLAGVGSSAEIDLIAKATTAAPIRGSSVPKAQALFGAARAKVGQS